MRTGEDGSFTLLGMAGRGLVTAKAFQGSASDFGARFGDRNVEGRYLMAVGADKIQGPRDGDSFITHPHICDASRYNTLLEVNPAKGVESIVRDVVLDPGKTVSGTILGPDGRPMKGASIASVFGVWLRVKDLPTAQFRIQGIDPKHPRAFYFRAHGEKLGAAVLFKGDESMPVTVRLQKCGTITGRLVDEDGLPCGAVLMGVIHKGQLNINSGVGTFTAVAAKDGRFRIEGVIPGLKISMLAGNNFNYFDQSDLVKELTLQPGDVKDLGDLLRKATD
jgi:hypothetical protein